MQTFKKVLPAILMIIFEIGVGVMLIIDAQRMAAWAFLAFGVILIIAALVLLIRFVIERKKENTDNPALVGAAVPLLIAGIVFTVAHQLLADMLGIIAVIFGAIMLISGVFKVVGFFMAKKEYTVAPGLAVFSGIVSLILGVVIMINPFGSLQVLGIFIGVSLIFGAVLDIISLISGGSKYKHVVIATTVNEKDDDLDLE
ncbi:MAG: DUF308 domain-containing protein [Ruminococcus sp.]|nr:DUF308 domain-containing protein [Ruminococcus sp.]MBQ9514487.1 DUF308 domain-containing protein [Ruminococcus sp.]